MEKETGNQFEGFNLLFSGEIPEIEIKDKAPDQEPETKLPDERKENPIETLEIKTVESPEEIEEIEEQEEEKETKKTSKKVEEENQEEEQEEDNLTIIAKHLAEQGILEAEIDEEFHSSDEGFSKLVEKTVEKKFEKYKDSLTNDTAKSFLEYLENGGKPETFIQAYSGVDYTTIETDSLEDDDNLAKKIITDSLIMEGFSNDEIKETLKDYEEGGILDRQAKRSLTKLQKAQTTQRENLVEQQKQQKQEYVKQHQEYLNTLKKDIETREDIAGFKFKSPKEKTEFYEYITKVDSRTGKTGLQKEIEADADSQ